MRLALLALLVVASAGCVQQGVPVDAADLTTADAPSSPDLGLSGSDCREGGGHSVHPKALNPLPDPWVPADVLDDVGPQLWWSEVPDPSDPTRPPEEGGTIGNYHATMACASWSFRGEARKDVVFGFVGMKVEPPAWDDGAAASQYLVSVVATSDPDVHAALVDAGIHAMTASASWTDAPGGALRVQMSTDHNGDYDSLFKPKPFGASPEGVVRLWFLHENEDGTFSPVALDLRTTEARHSVADGQGYFSHSGTHHHDPLPGAYGHTAAALYEEFDRTFSIGPRPDVVLDARYDH